MAGLLYFVPREVAKGLRPDVELLRELGLGHAFEGSIASREVMMAPANLTFGGMAGWLVADPRGLSDALLRFDPQQAWRSVPGTSCQVGRYTDQSTLPAELLRGETLSGHAVTMADGQSWVAPVARKLIEIDATLQWACRLPSTSKLGEDGRWSSGHVVGRYVRLWKIATAWWDTIHAAKVTETQADAVQVAFDFDGLHGSAVETLAANYRLGPAEADLLGLLSERTAMQVLNALVDLPVLNEWIKKKRPEWAGETLSI